MQRTYQTVHVVQRKMSPGVSVCKFYFKWQLVFVDSIDRDYLLKHSVADLGCVIWFIVPVLVWAWTDAIFGWQGVDWSMEQWRNVLEDKIAPTVGVKAVKRVKYAVDVIDQSSVVDLAVLDEGIISEIL